MDEKQKRRKLIIKIAVVFFAVLLVLTFFSNTIMNYSLPQVATAYTQKQVISAKIRGTGTITIANPVSIKVASDRTIDKISVSEGMDVKAGDVLFTLKDLSGEEYETAVRTLESLKNAFEKKIITEAIDDKLVNKIKAGNKINISEYSSRVKELKSNKDTLQAKYDDLSEQIAAFEAPGNAANSLSLALKNAGKNLDAVIERVGEDTENPEYIAALNAKTEAQNAYDAALDDLNGQIYNVKAELDRVTKEYEEVVTEIDTIESLESALKEIEDQQKVVDSYSTGNDGNQVKAESDGTVLEVLYQDGDAVAANETVVTIKSKDSGYEVEIPVTNAQAKKISIGDSPAIASSWYYTDAVATVTAIKRDKDNSGKGKKILCSVTGEVEAGQQLTLVFQDKSMEYDQVVPKSAIREDSKGKFVLVVKEKSSPLGNRYIAVRTAVKVLSDDDFNAAIDGAVTDGTYVVTTSEKPVKPGDYVRLKDK